MVLTGDDMRYNGTEMLQTNAISYKDGKLYVGSHIESPSKLGYIKVANATDCTYLEEHQVHNYLNEGCQWHDGYWWVVYHDYDYVERWSESWVYVDSYELTYSNSAYQGIEWIDDYIYVNNHAGAPASQTCDCYHWNGSAFEEVSRLTRPSTDSTQDLSKEPDEDVMWFAERNYDSAHWAVNSTITYGASQEYDWVDDDTSNVDSSIDNGTHSNFDNEKACDGTYDTLTEANTNPPVYENFSSYTIGDDPNNRISTTTTRATVTNLRVDEDAYLYYDKGANHFSGDFEHWMDVEVTDITAGEGARYYCWVLAETYGDYPTLITQDFLALYWYAFTGDPMRLYLREYYDSTMYSDYYAGLSLDTVYYLKVWRSSTAFKCRIYSSTSDRSADTNHIDELSLTLHAIVSYRYIQAVAAQDGAWRPDYVISGYVENLDLKETGGDNYELDLEIQWTTTNYTRSDEQLCIKTGTLDSEDIEVWEWNVTSSSWVQVTQDLSTASGWNNYTISCLTSATYTVRFLGGTETGDTTQSTWQIDCALLHTWETENTAPTINQLRITTLDDNNVTDDSISVNTEYYFQINATDDDNLSDLTNVTMRFANNPAQTIGEDSPNFVENSEYWCVFLVSSTTWKWHNGSAWDTATTYLNTSGCVYPSLSGTEGWFKFRLKVSKIASHTSTWEFASRIYDSEDENDTATFTSITIYFYSELTVESTHTWTNINPGTANQTVDGGSVQVNVTANGNVDLQARGNGSLTFDGNTIPLSNVLIHKDTLANAIALTTSYQNVPGLTSLSAGVTSHTFVLWLTVPDGTEDGTYVYQLTIQSVETP